MEARSVQPGADERRPGEVGPVEPCSAQVLPVEDRSGQGSAAEIACGLWVGMSHRAMRG